MKNGTKNFLKFFVFILLNAVIILLLNQAFIYDDTSIWSSDHRVEQYKKLPDNSIDVLFVGSSNVMSGINPLQLWKDTGIQSYAYCTRAQTFAFSYAYLQDAFKTQKPQCVVLDAFSVLTDKTTDGLINSDFHMSVNMDSLSVSSKSELLFKHVSPSQWISYFIPLFKNHNYYKTQQKIPDETNAIFMGYCYEDSCKSYKKPNYTDQIAAMDPVDLLYLEKILLLCKDNDVELYVIKTPICYPDKTHQKLNDVKSFCSSNGVNYYDMSIDAETWGFDFGADMRDAIHINSSGAVKVTRRLGELLKNQYSFNDAHKTQYAHIWEQEYERMTIFRNNMLNIK